jgi:hypothetical protein
MKRGDEKYIRYIQHFTSQFFSKTTDTLERGHCLPSLRRFTWKHKFVIEIVLEIRVSAF